jgi:hypothetical protein
MSYSLNDVIPLVSTDDRSPAELRKFLRFYHAYHEFHPLPEGWTDDLTGVIRAAKGEPMTDPRVNPEVVLTTQTGDRDLRVEVDLFSPVSVVVAFYDRSGEGLTVPEMLDLASTILGTEITLDDLDDYERALFLEGVISPGHPNDGTWTNHFRFCWDIPEPPFNL